MGASVSRAVPSKAGRRIPRVGFEATSRFQFGYHTFPVSLRPLPELPRIYSENIRSRVFSPPMWINKLVNEKKIVSPQVSDNALKRIGDNEMLELLGDKVLGLVVTELLIEKYPDLKTGSISQIYHIVVSNETLKQISLQYRLAECSCDLLGIPMLGDDSFSQSLGVHADLFEAYVGGLYREQGMITTPVKAWLEDLLAPHIEQAHTAVVKPTVTTTMTSSSIPSHPVNGVNTESFSSTESVATETEPISDVGVSAASSSSPPDNPVLALHNQLIKAKKDLTWTTTNVGIEYIWIAQAEVDGKVFCQGKGMTKAAAKVAAAEEGLSKLNETVEG